MRKLVLATILATAGAASAQCGTLAITGTGAAGTQLDIALTGATADSFALIFVAENTGSTPINLGPLLSLTIDLDAPLIALPLGGTDAAGDVSVSVTIPSQATTQISLNAQAGTFTLSFNPFTLGACTSNVVPFNVGG